MSDTFSDADLELGDVREGDAPAAAPNPDAGAVGGVIPEDDRVVPQTVDPSVVAAVGSHVDLASHVYVRAHHNLPGWGLLAARYEDGEHINADASDGWIPNNEEGIRAVELGFAEIVDAPEGAAPPEA